MTVNPGWGGQPFIEHSIQKLERLHAAAAAEVRDRGGRRHRREDRRRAARRAGASLFVAGSAVFGSADPAAAYGGCSRLKGRPHEWLTEERRTSRYC